MYTQIITVLCAASLVLGNPDGLQGLYAPPEASFSRAPEAPNLAVQSGPGNADDITVTKVLTSDVFSTLTNLFYNTIPVTLTEFLKTTVTLPTTQVLTTAVDDRVFVAKAPFTRTDTVSVTDTLTSYQCATEVSTDFYTLTHSAYDIRQQVITSTIVQTQFFKPTVFSTRIISQIDTSTVVQTLANTVYVDAPAFRPSFQTPQQTQLPGQLFGDQLSSQSGLQAERDSIFALLQQDQRTLVSDASALSFDQQQTFAGRLADQGLNLLTVQQMESFLRQISVKDLAEQVRLANIQRSYQLTQLNELDSVRAFNGPSGISAQDLRYSQPGY